MASVRTFLLLAVVLFAAEVTRAQVVHSTLSGGAWSEAATWTEGRLPTATDSVVIRGPVWLEDSVAVAALTITASGRLEGRAPTAAVNTSHVYNSGTLEAASHLTLILTDTAATLFNEGTWHTTRLWLRSRYTEWSTPAFVRSDTLHFGELRDPCPDYHWTLQTDWRFAGSFAPYYECQLYIDARHFGLYVQGESRPFFGPFATIYEAAFIEGLPAVLGGLTLTGNETLRLQGVLELGLVDINQIAQNIDTLIAGIIDFRKPFYNDGFVQGKPTLSFVSNLNIYQSIINRGLMKSVAIGIRRDTSISAQQVSLAPRPEMAQDVHVWPYENIPLMGSNSVPAFTQVVLGTPVLPEGKLHILPGASLDVFQLPTWNPYTGITLDISDYVYNEGKLTLRNVPVDTGAFIPLGALEIHGSSASDTIEVQHIADRRPPGFSRALRYWWRLIARDTSLMADTLVLRIPEAFREGIALDSLQVFYSSDEGLSWRILSRTYFHLFGSDALVVTQVPLHGIYAVAPLTRIFQYTTAAIDLQIMISPHPGRIRVGAPNDLYIQMTNLSDQTVPGDFLFVVVQYDTIAFAPESISFWTLDRSQYITWPIDSVQFSPNLGKIHFLATPLGPHETRTVAIRGWGRPQWIGEGKQQILAIPQAVLGVAISFGIDKVISFALDFCNGKLGIDGISLSDIPDFFREVADWTKRFADHGIIPLPPNIRTAYRIYELASNIETAANALECLMRLPKVESCAAALCPAPCPRSSTVPIADCIPYERFINCSTQNCPLPPPDAAKTAIFEPGQAWDPNAKAGPVGRYLNALERIPFTIFFENKAEATAPAYRIEIVDTLDGALDPSTVRFEGASHQGWQFSRSGNVLRWVIEGIELPPNVNPPEGEGYVLFSVEPLPELPTGTVIENRATIVFDMNEPLTTNTVRYVVDRTPPTSMPFALPETADSVLTLRWQAQDEGSGVAQVQVFASRDGRTFAPIATVPADRDTLQLKPEASGHYAFYTVAVDSAGNVQEEPSPVVETVVVSAETPVRLPEVFTLGAPYPHPAARWTWIPYSLPRRAHVRLALYDVTGRQVQVLFDGEQEAGYHQVLVRTHNLAAGLYFVRMEAPGGLQTVRLVVAR
ncbi:T9SS type A sorting domain-containing protein [Rhodothermus marinus]|uniref:T9SS type A sorting domain-containing protein n=1 Tax=Rhodothermus marinus TaxID=29549 RepID=UPI0037C65A2B